MLKELLDNNKYLICAGLSTLSLLFTSISIISVSKSVKQISTDLEPISEDDMYVFISERANCHYMAKSDPRYKVMRKDARPKGKRTDVLCRKIEKYASTNFPKDFVFHWLRVTFALRYYDSLIMIEQAKVEAKIQKRPRRFDIILRDVMRRLCHKDITVTQSYLNLFENFDERQEAQNAFENYVFKDFEDEFHNNEEGFSNVNT